MELMDKFVFRRTPKLRFGRGVLAEIGVELKALGVAKPLVVTDEGLKKAGVLDLVTKELDAAGVPYATYTGVVANPRNSTVAAAVEEYGKNGCDGLVSVGGGSSMDVAKSVGVVVANGGDIMDYEGAEMFSNPPPAHLCIPTTVGTGAEATVFAVIVDPDRHYKATIASPLMTPEAALLDPVLVENLPQAIAASTGLDAMIHAIECYTNIISNPLVDTLALGAIGLISDNLRPMVAEPKKHPDACFNMLVASTMAGMAFTNTRLGIVHSMSHPLSGFYDIPHGVANSILLPVIMEFNLMGCIDKMIDIAITMGENLEGLTEMEAARQAVVAVRQLMDDVGIPPRLRDVGCKDDQFDIMARDAMLSGNLAVNPRYCTAEIMVELYKQAF